MFAIDVIEFTTLLSFWNWNDAIQIAFGFFAVLWCLGGQEVRVLSKFLSIEFISMDLQLSFEILEGQIRLWSSVKSVLAAEAQIHLSEELWNEKLLSKV